MATWNYRVVRTKNESGDVLFRIHEVDYEEDGAIQSWTVEPVLPCGESTAELREDIRHFLAALQKNVLEEAEADGKSTLRPAYPDQVNLLTTIASWPGWKLGEPAMKVNHLG